MWWYQLVVDGIFLNDLFNVLGVSLSSTYVWGCTPSVENCLLILSHTSAIVFYWRFFSGLNNIELASNLYLTSKYSWPLAEK